MAGATRGAAAAAIAVACVGLLGLALTGYQVSSPCRVPWRPWCATLAQTARADAHPWRFSAGERMTAWRRDRRPGQSFSATRTDRCLARLGRPTGSRRLPSGST